MQLIYDFFGGRSTLFAFILVTAGIGLALFHKLDMSFVGLSTSLQAFVTARAISEDHIAPKV